MRINLYYSPREIEDDRNKGLLHNEKIISRGKLYERKRNNDG